MKSIVVGDGEVGKSLGEILGVPALGKGEFSTNSPNEVDVLHVCFPYSEEFESEVKRYRELFRPLYTVIHSTVPIGTCKKLGAFHSPVRGMHPNLANSMLTFTTYLAPRNHILTTYMEDHGFRVECVDKTENTEALKLMDTLQYGLSIMIEKEIHKFCQEHDLDFNVVYERANNSYRDGYLQLGKPNVVRPILEHQEGEIGGHCVIPNAKMVDFWLASLLLEQNETYGK